MDYRSRYGRWSTKYTEEVTSTQQLLSNPVTLDDQGQIIVVDSPFGLTDQQFLQKRFETEYTYQRGRNGWTLKAFSEDRQGEDDAASETAYGLGGLWTWRFASRTASFLGTGWEHDESGDNQQNDYWVSVIGLARVFTPDSGGLISYRYYQNDAESSDQGFRENRLNVRFSTKF